MSHLPWRAGAALVIVLLLLLVLGGGVAAGAVAPPLSDIEQLGKMLFFDQDLSLNGNQSCASCHAPEAGWTGPTSSVNAAGAVYEGSVPGAFGDRKPPSSAYGSFSPILYVDRTGTFIGGMFWDGRATGERLGSPLAEQAQGPFLNPMEQALSNAAEVVEIVQASGYADLFEDVWGDGLWDSTTAAYDAIGYSIAAYETSAESEAFTSKFDAWKAGTVSLTKQEAKGWALFNGKGKCGKCHIPRAVGGTPALFTDYTYDNLGIPKNPDNPATPPGSTWADPGLGGFLASSLDYATFAAQNLGKHKVPTLRNVDLRPYPAFVKAYGHNGYFKSLEEIVHFYNTRDVGVWPPPEVLDNVNSAELGNLGLTASQEADLVAFLRTLSDGYVPPAAAPAAAH